MIAFSPLAHQLAATFHLMATRHQPLNLSPMIALP